MGRARCGPSSTGSSLTAMTRRTCCSPPIVTPIVRRGRRGEAPVPVHFKERFAFAETLVPRPVEAAREEAVREQKRVSELVSAAIEDIHRAYRESVEAYPTIASLEAEIGGVPVRAVRSVAPELRLE